MLLVELVHVVAASTPQPMLAALGIALGVLHRVRLVRVAAPRAELLCPLRGGVITQRHGEGNARPRGRGVALDRAVQCVHHRREREGLVLVRVGVRVRARASARARARVRVRVRVRVSANLQVVGRGVLREVILHKERAGHREARGHRAAVLLVGARVVREETARVALEVAIHGRQPRGLARGVEQGAD
eukprot:scaffold42247_cov56-Phaeocystis_antarctica.AAC.1